METKQNTWVILALAAILVAGPIACGKEDGIGERTGKALDEAAEEIKDGAEEVGKAIEDGAEDVSEAVEEGSEEAEKAMKDLTD